jgi:hypothetical protein
VRLIEAACYTKVATGSDDIYKIVISNANEEASSGDEKDAAMLSEDTNTYSSNSELANSLFYPPSRYGYFHRISYKNGRCELRWSQTERYGNCSNLFKALHSSAIEL